MSVDAGTGGRRVGMRNARGGAGHVGHGARSEVRLLINISLDKDISEVSVSLIRLMYKGAILQTAG